MVSNVKSFGALIALTVYAIGKTFFWPTMLAVASDRFPRCGAVAISIMGGLGMMSAGLVGSPGLGHARTGSSGEVLEKNSPAVYQGIQVRHRQPMAHLQNPWHRRTKLAKGH